MVRSREEGKNRAAALLPWAYLIFSSSWLFAPFVNNSLASRLTLISEYEAVGQPWSLVFRLCDLLAAAIFLYALSLLFKKKPSDIPPVVLTLLLVFGIGLAIDALFPVSCGAIRHYACIETHSNFWYVHATESVITAVVIFVATGIMARRRDRLAALAFVGQAVLGLYAILGFVVDHPPSTLLQMADQLLIILWLTRFLYVHLAPPRQPALSQPITTKLITIWVAFNGFAALLGATVWHGVMHGPAGVFYFAGNLTWLAEHSVLVGLALLYITRQLWRGEHRAWQIATILVWMEVLKYAVIVPSPFLVVMYFAVGIILLAEERSFNRHSRFKYRDAIASIWLPLIGFGLLFLSAVLFVYVRNPEAWQDITATGSELTRRVFLIGPYLHPHRHVVRLMSDVLRAGISGMLLLLLFSLFAPLGSSEDTASAEERKRFEMLLKRQAVSSEDAFKLWPEDKRYFWHGNSAAIAYKLSGPAAFMLPDAIGPAATRPAATRDFMLFCRQNGWEACAINVPPVSLKYYEKLDFKTIRIGANAVIDIEHFTHKTLRSKWWRWIMNRGTRQGWTYEVTPPPHAPQLLAELHQVSNQWLKREGRRERSFALGYFDAAYLQGCRLHVLRNRAGKVIAFVNELPRYHSVRTASIDLMRFVPGNEGVLAFLLANTLQTLQAEKDCKQFDLGFVPLAAPAGRFDRAVAQVGRFLAGERVSAKGLEQFKNKFEPDWQPSYLAFDGDWPDIIAIAAEIDNVLEVA